MWDQYDTIYTDNSSATAEDAKFARQQEVAMNQGALPVITDQTTASGTADPSTVAKLGSINVLQTARDAGTLYGTIQRDISQIGPTFNQAKNNAASGNALGQWWQYSTTTDKLVVGLAAVTLIVMLSGKGL